MEQDPKTEKPKTVTAADMRQQNQRIAMQLQERLTAVETQLKKLLSHDATRSQVAKGAKKRELDAELSKDRSLYELIKLIEAVLHLTVNTLAQRINGIDVVADLMFDVLRAEIPDFEKKLQEVQAVKIAERQKVVAAQAAETAGSAEAAQPTPRALGLDEAIKAAKAKLGSKPPENAPINEGLEIIQFPAKS